MIAESIMLCSLIVVSGFQTPADTDFAGFHYLSTDYHFVEDLVNFIEVEHKVELADASKVLVENFDKQVNELKHW